MSNIDYRLLQGARGFHLANYARDAEERSTSPAPLRVARRSEGHWPAPMRPEAFHGPIGDAVKALEEKIEACREALLIELLVFFGSAAGRTAYVKVQRTRHYGNLYVALVGRSSRSRKGSTRDVAADLIGSADLTWQADAIIGGATSGEGIVASVRDPQRKRRRATKDERKDPMLLNVIDDDGFIDEEVDPGVGDKRRVFDEGELSAIFKIATRDGNTLSERLRTFYDQGRGEIVNKNSPMRATNAHIAINGHITAEELRERLTELDAASGWANRFLYVATRRVRRIPFGTPIEDSSFRSLAVPLARALAWVREREPQITWGESAKDRWRGFYEAISDDTQGLADRLTDRGEAHVLRLSELYAVADQSSTIELPHLEAGLAVWDYCAASVAWVWGAALGNRIAEKILVALRIGEKTRTELRDLFSRNVSEAQMTGALDLLRTRGYAEMTTRPSGGRPTEVWRIPPHDENDQSDESRRG